MPGVLLNDIWRAAWIRAENASQRRKTAVVFAYLVYTVAVACDAVGCVGAG